MNKLLNEGHISGKWETEKDLNDMQNAIFSYLMVNESISEEIRIEDTNFLTTINNGKSLHLAKSIDPLNTVALCGLRGVGFNIPFTMQNKMNRPCCTRCYTIASKM